MTFWTNDEIRAWLAAHGSAGIDLAVARSLRTSQRADMQREAERLEARARENLRGPCPEAPSPLWAGIGGTP